MSISSRFSVAIHILSLLEINKEHTNTSEFIAASVNTNPVVIRRITGMLNRAGLVEARPGVAGAKLAREASDITLLDIYNAVNVVNEDELFGIHESPNPECVVGRNIQAAIVPLFISAQKAMEKVLQDVSLQDIIQDISSHEI